MAWPPTERGILEVARDSNLTTGISVPLLSAGDGQMAMGKVPNDIAVFSPEYLEPLIEKGLLAKHEGEHCTLYTLTEAGHAAVNACN